MNEAKRTSGAAEARIDAFVVSHTHWDREWYLPRERFSLVLVKLVDRLLEILDSEPEYGPFLFDGQTIALNDYLELCPEREKQLREHIASGRIVIGPWYVLPDEVLVSGEAHIRNFLEGGRDCERFGGRMMTGYLPDSFGHPSQMPAILRGLGLEEIVFWRGLGPDIESSEFTWSGFDGTTVLGLNMPLSYGVGAALPADDKEFLERIEKRVSELEVISETTAVLLMNGVDHMAPERHLPERIAEANRRQDRIALTQSTLEEYVEVVRNRIDESKLPIADGELRSGFRAYLLGGTLSTRMYLKQWNSRVESLLERELEPALTAAAVLGTQPYPAGTMHHLWRRALCNLPHDSICGCSVDEVHEAMVGRYREIVSMGEALRDECLVGFDSGDEGMRLIVFNPHPVDADEWVEAEVDLFKQLARRVDHDDARLVEYETEGEQPTPDSVFVRPVGGEHVEAEVIGWRKTESMELSLDDQPVMYRVVRTRLRFRARDLPAMGYRLFVIDAQRAGDAAGADGRSYSRIDPTEQNDTVLENDWYRIEAAEGGSITVTDLRTGRRFSGIARLEDGGDAGDEYTFCPPEHDSIIRPDDSSVSVTRVDTHTIEVVGELALPTGLRTDRVSRNEETVGCSFATRVRLMPGSRRVDVTVDFDNGAADHRLRICFPTPFDTNRSYAEGTFCVDERTLADSGADYASWVEPPSGVFSQKAFATVTDDTDCLTVFNRGLPEYELSRQGGGAAILVTLLRCVGRLSRVDLDCRAGNAGWPLETPGAQCPGRHRFEFALMAHPVEEFTRVPSHSRLFLTPPFAVQARPTVDSESGLSAPLASRDSVFRLTGDGIVLSAFKPAESGDGYILRLVNPFTEPATGRVEWNAKSAGPIDRVVRCSLAEIELDSIPSLPDLIERELRGGEIVTLLVVTAK